MSKQLSIGLGCVTFGREIGPVASFAMMDHAVEKGISLFDTAAAYGSGASEEIIGAWLANRRPSQPPLIATKLLPPFEPDRMETCVDESLKRLGIDVIDMLYLHQWDPSCEKAEVLYVLERLRNKGKIKECGASNFSVDQLQRLLHLQSAYKYSPIRAVQNNHNLAVSDINDAFRQLCKEHGIEIITYSPLGAGFLTGKYKNGLESGSRFERVPGHQQIYFQDAAFRRLERLQLVAARTGYLSEHLALAWALHQEVSTVLIGGRTPAHLDQAFAALSFCDAALFAELERD